MSPRGDDAVNHRLETIMRRKASFGFAAGLILPLACCTTAPTGQGAGTVANLSPQETKSIVYEAANDLAARSYLGDLADVVNRCYASAKTPRDYDVCMAFDAASTSRFENGFQTGSNLHPPSYFSASRLSGRLRTFADRGFGNLQLTVDWMSANLGDVVEISRFNHYGPSFL